jgi:hypothetical protein
MSTESHMPEVRLSIIVKGFCAQDFSSLPIVMPSIPAAGTKSRVETQIRLVFDLASAEPSPGVPYNRVGSWRWLKLPKGTATKRRARKGTKISE